MKHGATWRTKSAKVPEDIGNAIVKDVDLNLPAPYMDRSLRDHVPQIGRHRRFFFVVLAKEIFLNKVHMGRTRMKGWKK